MKIGLFYTDYGFGPGKVSNGLTKGLVMNGDDVIVNNHGDINGCLQSWCHHYNTLPKDTLAGPNLFNYPTEQQYLNGWDRYNYFLFASQWNLNQYSNHPKAKGKNLQVWSAGIDTDGFNEIPKDIEYDCFVYIKTSTNQVSHQKIDSVKDFLNRNNIKYTTLMYGHYNESQLKETIKKSKFCILLTGTETQGIGYMEILSTNTPCYVINQTKWEYDGMSGPATSVPYFNNECGIIDDINMNRFNEFVGKLKNFSPREYILREHTLQIAASKYKRHLLKSHNRS